MATPIREFSLDHHLFERMKHSGIEPENLSDLISIVVSLKNKYGLAPLGAVAHGYPVPNGLTVRYTMESITLNKVINVLLDTPRLSCVSIAPQGIPRSTQFEVQIALGG